MQFPNWQKCRIECIALTNSLILFLVLFTLGFELLFSYQTELGLHSEQVVLVGILLCLFTLGARALHHVACLFLPGFAEVLLLLLGFVIGAHVNAPFLYVLALFHFARPESLNVLFFVIERLAHVAVHLEEVKSAQVLVTVGHELSAPFRDGGVRGWLLELEVGRG